MTTTRRSCLLGLGTLGLGGFGGLRGRPAFAAAPPDSSLAWREPELAREVVGKSHFDLDRVRELVGERPELARAAWDWGFGDWETALGAASHTGRIEIARYLMQNGARATLFTHAMLGRLEVVRATVEADPGIETVPGPHGISLLAHARAGGDPAAEVAAYLENLGTADLQPARLLDPADRDRILGRYEGDAGWMEISVHPRRSDEIRLEAPGESARPLIHRGDLDFSPAGVPSVRVTFPGEDRLEIDGAGVRWRGRRVEPVGD